MPNAPDPPSRPTISSCCGFVPIAERFPKSQKFVFDDRMLKLALDVLEFLVEATKRAALLHLLTAEVGTNRTQRTLPTFYEYTS
jgi:hypothetical protein